jgi:hypothetical protein
MQMRRIIVIIKINICGGNTTGKQNVLGVGRCCAMTKPATFRPRTAIICWLYSTSGGELLLMMAEESFVTKHQVALLASFVVSSLMPNIIGRAFRENNLYKDTILNLIVNYFVINQCIEWQVPTMAGDKDIQNKVDSKCVVRWKNAFFGEGKEKSGKPHVKMACRVKYVHYTFKDMYSKISSFPDELTVD